MRNKLYPSTFFQTILYFLIGFIIATPLAMPFIFFEKQISQILPQNLPMILIYLIVMSILILLAYFVNSRRKIYGKCNFKLTSMHQLTFMLLLLFTFQLGLNLPFQKVLYSLINVYKTDSLFSWIYILSALLLAPIFEEILFRGIILRGLLSTYSPSKSIIISAIIFGIFHGQLSMIPGAIFLGLCFGYVYFKTNSLGSPILLHFAANLFGIIASLINHKLGNPNFNFFSEIYGNYSLQLIGILIISFLLTSYFIVKKERNEQFLKKISPIDWLLFK